MQCPPKIAEILSEILRTGLLRIRTCGWSGSADRCAVEADHLHNLPGPLSDFTPECLAYYLHAERVGYIGQSSPEEIAAFEPLWTALAAAFTEPGNSAMDPVSVARAARQ
jgi:hypothetical protein